MPGLSGRWQSVLSLRPALDSAWIDNGQGPVYWMSMSRRLAALLFLASCSPWRVDLRGESGRRAAVDSSPPVTDSGAAELGCAGGELVQGSAVVSFEEHNRACPWMSGDNLYPFGGRMMARVEQEGLVPLPTGSRLCGLTLTGVGWENETPFEDHFLLTVADVAVASSSTAMVDVLLGAGRPPRYDWSLVVGEEFDAGDGTPWCLSESLDADCELPGPSLPGPLLVSPDDAGVELLREHVGAPLAVGLVVVGDDDIIDDCNHAALDVTVGWQVVLQ